MKLRTWLLLGAIGLCLEDPALAQTRSMPMQSAETGELEEVVVTAQKRAQSINSVGMTITAATGEALADLGVRDTKDLTKVVSGLTFQPTATGTPVLTLRGVGVYDNGIATSPAITVYVDQVPVPYPLMTLGASLDVERVEVLKGPQGTLFGQNSTGGAINYIAARPTDHLAAGLDTSYERFGRIDTTAFISGPITDTLRVRLAGRFAKGGDWQYSLTRPSDTHGEADQYDGRLLVDWDPTDTLSFKLNANGFRNKTDTTAPQLQFNELNVAAAPNPANPFAVIDPARFAQLTNPSSPGYDASLLGRQTLAYARLAGAEGPALQAGTLALMSAPIAPNNDRAADWAPGYAPRRNDSYHQLSIRADLKLNEGLTFTSITAYQQLSADAISNIDGTAADSVSQQNYGFNKSFNQEVRLAGDSAKNHWIIGGSYDHLESEESVLGLTPNSSINEAIPGLVFTQVLANVKQKADTYSVFGNMEQEVLPGLSLLAGLRYSKDDHKASYCASDPSSNQNLSNTFNILEDVFTSLGLKTTPIVPIGPGQCYALTPFPDGSPTIIPVQRTLNESNISWRLGVNYQLENGALLYISDSRGFKSGIFTAISASSTTQYDPARQERVDAYEMGVKAPLVNRRLQINGAVFDYEYKDKQQRVRVLDPIFGLLERLVNVPKSRVWGLEGELISTPLDGLRLSLSGTYLNSKITQSDAPFYNQQGFRGTFEGSRLPYTPEFTGIADVGYEWNIGGRLRANIGAALNYHSADIATFETPQLPASDFHLKSYALLDLRAGIGSRDDRWNVSVYGRNVTDTFYTTSGFSGSETTYRYTGMPATYGLDVQFRY